MKFRFKYGKKLSFGLVRKVRDNNAVQTGKERGANMISSNAGGATGLKVTLVHILAKTKDIVLFGVPAGIVWLVLLVSKKRYTGLYVIACKR